MHKRWGFLKLREHFLNPNKHVATNHTKTHFFCLNPLEWIPNPGMESPLKDPVLVLSLGVIRVLHLFRVFLVLQASQSHVYLENTSLQISSYYAISNFKTVIL